VISLRPYQNEIVERIRNSFISGKNRPLLVLPTGGGKTVCFSYITSGASAKGNRVMILVHRQELLDQCHRSLLAIGVEHGLIASGRTQDPTKNVQVASVQTLVRRLEQTKEPDLIIMDEAHHACAGSWGKVLNRWANARVLGVTATPERLDGKGLGSVFDDLVVGLDVSELINQKFLCQPIYYAPSVVDLSAVKTVAGDYDRKQLNEVMGSPKITGNAVEHYKRICNGTPAIAFCTSIEHATQISNAFNESGVKSAVIDGKLSDAERMDRIKSLSDGRISVLTSCEIVSEGFDLPSCTTAILLRPTQSLSLHLQQIGRVLRISENKPNAFILDHAGNCLRHGLAEEKRNWSLQGREKKKKSQIAGEKYKQCEKCYRIFKSGNACPECGHVIEVKSRIVEQVDGDLEQLKIDAEQLRLQREKKAQQGKARSLQDLIAVGRARGMKNPSAWAYYVFNARNRNK
jgi:superfamily II DNA or RNA helicase